MKITPDHLARGAFIYVRQSTADQLANNHESRRRQYGLAEHARILGWTDVTVIDDDLGRSGSGVSRPGFERLLAAICEGRVGAVFAIEASRLARNGRDWHTLIEFCGLVGTLIVDEDGTYSAQDPNDRLLLGMKGTMSELELSLLRARSMEALRQKARRGELYSIVAVGYVRVGRGRIELDPDLRVREAIGLVFARFAEMQSIRQVFLSLRADRIALPYIDHKHPGERRPLWKLPVYTTVNNFLANPVYAGAYAFARTGSRTTIENGRKRVLRGRRKARSDWAVLLVDHHEGYLPWAEYERNQRKRPALTRRQRRWFCGAPDGSMSGVHGRWVIGSNSGKPMSTHAGRAGTPRKPTASAMASRPRPCGSGKRGSPKRRPAWPRPTASRTEARPEEGLKRSLAPPLAFLRTMPRPWTCSPTRASAGPGRWSSGSRSSSTRCARGCRLSGSPGCPD